MKKLLFLFLLITCGCAESGSPQLPQESNISKIWVDPDTNAKAGSPIKLWVELDNTPKSGTWKFDFVLNGTVVDSFDANGDGWIGTFHEYTPDSPGTFTYEGVLYSGTTKVTKSIEFEVF